MGSQEKKFSNALNKPWYKVESGYIKNLSGQKLCVDDVVKHLNESTELSIRNANIIKILNSVQLSDVLKEKKRQVELWDVQNHTPFEYLAILGEEVGEANQAAVDSYDFYNRKFDREKLRSGKDSFRTEMVQVAAVALSIIECVDRNDWVG